MRPLPQVVTKAAGLCWALPIHEEATKPNGEEIDERDAQPAGAGMTLKRCEISNMAQNKPSSSKTESFHVLARLEKTNGLQ